MIRTQRERERMARIRHLRSHGWTWGRIAREFRMDAEDVEDEYHYAVRWGIRETGEAASF